MCSRTESTMSARSAGSAPDEATVEVGEVGRDERRDGTHQAMPFMRWSTPVRNGSQTATKERSASRPSSVSAW